MSTGTYLPRTFLSNVQKMARGIWPWTVGVRSRFPLHYKRNFVQKYMLAAAPVHYVADERRHKLENGVKVRVQNVPIPLKLPREADDGLWGGEGIIEGFAKKKNLHFKPRHPKVWLPSLLRRVFYSEILDRWLAINVTSRTLDLIDDAYGFDFYILKTPEVDLKSALGMRLKREMLAAVSRRTFYPDDQARVDEVYERYRRYLIPDEEIEWIGLSLDEAEKKQEALDAKTERDAVRPLKDVFMEEMVARLQAGEPLDDSPRESWTSKINPFKSEAKSD